MKNYKIVSALFFVAALTGCSQKLPYDLDGVEKGVVINIQKPLGAAAAMQQDKSDVFDVILNIPSQQGDWSMLDKAFLTAVYNIMEKRPPQILTKSSLNSLARSR